MTGPKGNRLPICPLSIRIGSSKIPLILAATQSIETLGETILNLSRQIDLPIAIETSHYFLNVLLEREFDAGTTDN